MNFRRVEPDDRRHLCAQCGLTIRSGQVRVSQRLGTQHPITHRDIYWHASCIRTFMETVPPDTDEQAFCDLRDRIATAGVAFPD